MLGGGQVGLELGPGAEARHIGQEQGLGVLAARGQDLVIQQQVQQVVVHEGDLAAHNEGLIDALMLSIRCFQLKGR